MIGQDVAQGYEMHLVRCGHAGLVVNRSHSIGSICMDELFYGGFVFLKKSPFNVSGRCQAQWVGPARNPNVGPPLKSITPLTQNTHPFPLLQWGNGRGHQRPFFISIQTASSPFKKRNMNQESPSSSPSVFLFALAKCFKKPLTKEKGRKLLQRSSPSTNWLTHQAFLSKPMDNSKCLSGRNFQ